MAELGFREAARRYRRLFWPMMVLYVVLCIGGALIHKSMDQPAPWLSAILALLGAAPVVAVFWLLARFIRETDEYTRMIQTSAMLSGGFIVFSVSIVWGFLELYDAISPMTGFPAILLAAPGFLFAYGISFLVQSLRRGETLREAIKGDPMCIGIGKDHA